MRAMLASVEKRTGKALSVWDEVVKATGLEDVSFAAAKLKADHGLGKPTAWMLASHALGGNIAEYDEAANIKAAPALYKAQYKGKKAHLKPIAEKLFEIAFSFGEDIAASPCKTYVPLYRQHVVAHVKAATQKRVDLELALAKYDGELPKVLKDTGGAHKGDRITHKIGLMSTDDITDEVVHWLRLAYDLDKE
jgi:hypothetical protein